MSLIHHQNTSCTICGGPVARVLDMPAFPLTGIYVEPGLDDGRFPAVDQALMVCGACGHAQLLNVLDTTYLYGSTYTHRSSASPIATSGNDFFFEFLKSVAGGRRFRRAVDVGCNDVYLLKKVSAVADELIGIDPIWQGRESEVAAPLRVVGRFVEALDIEHDLGGAPDLVVSAHTFEHIDRPREQLQHLMSSAAGDALFVVEVPGFDSLLANYRFDQVFHQHLQYFSLESFDRMLELIGARRVAHTFNYGYWGGTLLVAFSRSTGSAAVNGRPPKPTAEMVQARHRVFRQQLDSAMAVVGSITSCPIYGYGAAQMVPTLAYNLRSDLSFLRAILDDNPDRVGRAYPGLPVPIANPTSAGDLSDAAIMITALDSARPILRRILHDRPRHVVMPLTVVS
jgi:hypothetical protein